MQPSLTGHGRRAGTSWEGIDGLRRQGFQKIRSHWYAEGAVGLTVYPQDHHPFRHLSYPLLEILLPEP